MTLLCFQIDLCMENQVKNLVIAMIELSETNLKRILTKFILMMSCCGSGA